MQNANDPKFSRRRAMGIISAPIAAAAMVSSSLVSRYTQAAVGSSAAVPRVYNICDFGAVGDGRTVNTAAVQAAVDACTRDGCSIVMVPAGEFVTGAIELKSNVTLHVTAGGVLRGSPDGKDYHAVEAIPLTGDATLNDGNWGFLFAVNAVNVNIEGPGTIEGSPPMPLDEAQHHAVPAGLGGPRRPYLLLFYRCKNISVRNIDLCRSAYHCVRAIQSSYLHMDDLHIFNRIAGNNDGFHFVSCEHVTVNNCKVECTDDACALFGACKFVAVTNSSFSTRWSVFRFGSEGVAENITVSNCLIYEVHGCPIKVQGRPGYRLENASFSNLIFQNVTGPISISIGSEGDTAEYPQHGGAGDTPPAVCRNISFNNIHGNVTSDPGQYADMPMQFTYGPGHKFACIVLNAINGAVIENISFNNIHLTFGGGGTAEMAARRQLPNMAGEYFRLGPLPAYAFYARNARGITLNDVRFQLASPDLRPAVIFDHVTDIAINGMSAQGDADAESLMRFINTRQALVTGARVLNPVAAFARVEGAQSAGIVIDASDLSNATTPLTFAAGAAPSAVSLHGK